jgi:hypothetical protein
MSAKRSNPEAALQIAVKRYLDIALLPPHVPGSLVWTACLTGTHLSRQARSRARAMGVKRGFPDLQFLFPDGVTRYIELKAGASLSPEQKDFRDRCAPHGIFAVCRSVDEVATVLRGWGAPLRERRAA